MQEISVSELADWIDDSAGEDGRPPLLLDVREPWEHELCRLAGSLLIPMNEVPGRVRELDAEADIVVICHHGVRSMQVAMYLENNGFGSVRNLTGGVDAWAHEVDPSMPKY